MSKNSCIKDSLSAVLLFIFMLSALWIKLKTRSISEMSNVKIGLL